jgi:peptidyl-prolyl cis-trans isomerase B (cyclophilin B)
MIEFKTNYGDFTLELRPDLTPKTVENFLRYVTEGFFAGTIFHRVIPGFVIQGGGFTPGMTQKATHAPIPNEADTGLKNTLGTISMARTSDPDSASSQFFINLQNNDFLDHKAKTPAQWGYCAFGQVVKGIEVVQKIAQVATGNKSGHQDVPTTDVIVESVTVLEAALPA